MLEKVISKLKEKISQQLQIQEEKEKEVELLKNELEMLKKEEKTCDASLALIPVEGKRKFNIFQKIFSRKYKEYVKQKDQEEAKHQELIEKANAIDEKISAIRSKLFYKEQEIKSFDKESLIKKIEALGDETKAIEIIIADYPELTERIDFMKELVEKSPEYIKYDKTDDKNIYILYLNATKDSFRNSIGEIDPERTMQFEECIKQLENPKPVPDDKYEIQMKYLFEEIRKVTNVPGVVKFYNENNGKFPAEYGKFLEKLYDNPETVLAIHGLGRNSGLDDKSVERNEKIKKQIMREGVKATNSMGELEGITSPKLWATTYYQGEGLTFFDVLDYDYASTYGYFLLEIPKAGLEKEGNIPIWGTNSKNLGSYYGSNRNYYLLPEFIKGFITTRGRLIQPEERRVEEKTDYTHDEAYKYHAYDFSVHSTTVIEELDEERE